MGKCLINKEFDEAKYFVNYDYIYFVFNRGFKWPYCVKHMMQLHQDADKFEEKKIKLIAICPEKIEKVKKFQEEKNLNFDLVSDYDHYLADKYGQETKILKLGRMPAQIIIDKERKIFCKHYASSMRDIIENDEVLKKL